MFHRLAAARFSSRCWAPATAATAATTAALWTAAKCDAPAPQTPQPAGDAGEGDAGSQDQQDTYNDYVFNGFTPRKPTVPYPGWDPNWDARAPPKLEKGAPKPRSGSSRHLILIRHGQYDETHREDELRILTPLGADVYSLFLDSTAEVCLSSVSRLTDGCVVGACPGRQQAEATGQRLAELVAAGVEIKAVHVSDLARAKETAEIIKKYLPGATATKPNPNLNEGRPAHVCPGGRPDKPRMSTKSVERDSPRIEAAFHTHFYRSDPLPRLEDPAQEEEKNQPKPLGAGSSGAWAWESGFADELTRGKTPPAAKQEYEIVVAHGNVIRYMVCRALQLPPEAWLRFSTFNCSLTYTLRQE